MTQTSAVENIDYVYIKGFLTSLHRLGGLFSTTIIRKIGTRDEFEVFVGHETMYICYVPGIVALCLILPPRI